MSITFQATLATQQSGLVDGRQDVIIEIRDGNNPAPVWTETHRDVQFLNGTFSIILGNTEPFERLNGNIFSGIADPRFAIKLPGLTTSTAFFPIPSSPYAVHSHIAEEVEVVRAERIVGDFTNTVNITNDLNVDNATLFANSSTNRVGVGTPTPSFTLDVRGIVNAEAFQVMGNDIETVLSWRRRNNDIFYTDGFVGVGTSDPQFQLDVAGTLNATELRIDGQLIQDFLSRNLLWIRTTNPSAPNIPDIYFNNGTGPGSVGIGTTRPIEKLDVRGAIRIALASQANPVPGTIQYDATQDDFFGHTADGKFSLTGLQGGGSTGQVAFWTANDRLSGNDQFFWNNASANLGIGTNVPRAKLDIQGQFLGTALLSAHYFINTQNNQILLVDNRGVAIGTTNTRLATLNIDGLINADDYLINGARLVDSLSNDSFWLQENFGRIFYDVGNVGIGTRTPGSLLEIASPTGSPQITFDIGGVDLFTLGIDPAVPSAFVIATGGNLDVPVFVFNGENIGVGTKLPSANLHVSGNLGVLFTGTLGAPTPPLVSGEGTRLMWIPSLGAFRAGHAAGEEWDQGNIGRFSVAMGSRPSANGEGSFIGGGHGNVAAGLYSAVPGGLFNEALADYSLAAGHQARVLQTHNGTFVWSDYTPSLNHFESSAPNQFLIRAFNGVGIGTTRTIGTVLTIAKNTPRGLLFRAIGNADAPDAMTITTSGNIGIGTSDPGTARLSVQGGFVGVGTTQPIAPLTVSRNSNNGSDLVFAALGANGLTTPAMVVTVSGNVGIGTSRPTASLHVVGSIIGTSFQIVDPNNPNATINLTPNPGSPWAAPTDNNTFFNIGNVGIGTPSPNSLLEISNRSGSDPVLTFDIGGTDIFSIGATLNFLTFQPGGSLTTTPSLTLNPNGVGIGIGLRTPNAALEVSGNVVVSSSIAVGTTNVSSGFALNVDGIVNTNRLFIGGGEFIPLPTPWSSSGNFIFYTSGNVGIGTSSPGALLDVAGLVSVNILNVGGSFSVNGTIDTDFLRLEDQASPGAFGSLFVATTNLNYVDPSGNTKVISSPLVKGTGDRGNLAFFVNNSTLGTSQIFWDNLLSQMNISGNLTVVNGTPGSDSFQITNNVVFGSPVGVFVQSELSHDGQIGVIEDFDSQRIRVNVAENWGTQTGTVFVKGLDIDIDTGANTLLNNATAVGLFVDVSGVNVDPDPLNLGRKAAAIFRGGNVGIGTLSPSVELEIAGTVSANFFNLTGGLSVPNLTVGGDTLVAFRATNAPFGPLVGIGLSNPSTELEVAGTISANTLTISNGLQSGTLNVGQGSFVVNASGNIGIGTTTPDPFGQIDILKVIETALTDPFVSEKIRLVIDGDPAQQSGGSFDLDQDITGIDIALQSNANSELETGRTATGLRIDISDLKLANSATAIGLDVDVSGTTGTRHAAIFRGGFVGIGLVTPQAELHVSGNILADNLFLEGALQAQTATFGTLLVQQSASFNGTVTVNNLVVLNGITANTFVTLSTLKGPDATFASITAGSASINGTLRAATLNLTATLNAFSGTFSQSLGVGTTAPASGLAVSGDITARSVFLSQSLVLNTATLNVNASNTSGLFVTQFGNVGIGTLTPTGNLHVNTLINAGFIPGLNTTWGIARIQNQSNAGNSASGIILVPDAGTPSVSVGSGIVAVKASAVQSGSHLVFVTDPVGGALPEERIRITQTGRVGIGTTTPVSLLDVGGDARISGNLQVLGSLRTGLITGDSGVTINPNGVLRIEGTASTNVGIRVGNGLFLRQIAPPTPLTNYGNLYVDQSDLNLYYVNPAGTLFNLSVGFNGEPNRVPFFQSNGTLSDDADLFYVTRQTGVTTVNALVVGTGNSMTAVEIVTTINNDFRGRFSAEQIRLGFGFRAPVPLPSPGETEFTGLRIKFDAENLGQNFDFGRLANNEVAVGLHVDIRDVVGSSFLGNLNADGLKIAGLFLGGNVGIGTSEPLAQLHLVTETAGDQALRVDSRNGSGLKEFALVVSSNGNVGIGDSAPDAVLSIQGLTNTAAGQTLLVRNLAGNPIMSALNNRTVGVGLLTPLTTLHVSGNFRVDANTNTHAIFVDTNGRVGMGQNVPLAALHVLDDIPLRIDATNRQFALTVTTNGLVGVGTAVPENALHVAGKIHSGVVTSNIAPPAFMTLSNTQGLFIETGNADAFLGLRNRTGDPGPIDAYDTVLLFGDTDADHNLLFITTSNREVMRLTAAGQLGIGGIVPSASLHVSGNYPLQVDALTMPYALVVSTNGNVGIGVGTPDRKLMVNGRMTTRELFVTEGEINVATLNLTSHLNVQRIINVDADATAQVVEMIISQNIGGADRILSGLDIVLDSALHDDVTGLDSAIYNGAIAYGLRVDVTGVNVESPNFPIDPHGQKYSAVFLGGNVGIGVTNPSVALHVVSEDDFIARFGTNIGDVTLRAYDTTVRSAIGWNMRNSTQGETAVFFPTLLMVENRVGINIPQPQPDQAFLNQMDFPQGDAGFNAGTRLVVNGDVRLGVVRRLIPDTTPVDPTTTQAQRLGARLFFSGGPDISQPLNSDNGDDIWMARENVVSQRSNLLANVGGGSVGDQFQVGFTFANDFVHVLSVYSTGTEGRVGIQSGGEQNFVPDTRLHVKGITDGTGTARENHVVVFENRGLANADTLALVHTDLTNLGTDANFITFFNDATAVGAIEGNVSGNGVNFKTNGADYAEYLPKRFLDETFAKGDILGVRNGKVSKKTDDAQQVMARSYAPSVAANWPGDKKKKDYVLTAFFGQVPIKVVGPVSPGDYIVPSGKNDGTGIAVKRDQLTPNMASQIVGRAWEGSDKEKMKFINTAVGFNFSTPELQTDMKSIEALADRVETLRKERMELEARFDAELQAQNDEIERLLNLANNPE